jgi:hypothetical protein
MIVLYVFNAAFNSILAISWYWVLLVEESGVPWDMISYWKSEYLERNLELLLLDYTTEQESTALNEIAQRTVLKQRQYMSSLSYEFR